MKIFVAGATGQLGLPAVRELVARGHEVRGSARGEDKPALLRSIGVEPAALDLYDRESLRAAMRGCDAAIRLTTKIGPFREWRKRGSWDETVRLRTEGARALVDAAVAEGVGIYVHESVTFVYADGGDAWITEDSPVDAGDSAIMKGTLNGEREAARFTAGGGRGVVLRFAGFYSPEAPNTLAIIKMARRHMLGYFGDGANYYSSIDVPDAAAAVASSLDVPAGIYNIGDNEPLHFKAYLRLMAEHVGLPRPMRSPRFVARFVLGEVARYALRSQRISNARFKQTATWEPAVPDAATGWRLIAQKLAAA